MFTDKQWELMDEAIAILHPYRTATTLLQGQDYETASLPLPFIQTCNRRLKPDRHKDISQNVVKDECLSLPAQLFRKQLLKEMNERFPFTRDTVKAADRLYEANRFVIPTFFNPKYKQLDRIAGLDKALIAVAMSRVRREMLQVLKPLHDHLTSI